MAEGGIIALFMLHRDSLRRLLLARGFSADAVDDLLQDVWLRIESARIGPVADPLAYLMRVAMNLATDRRKAARRREAREEGWGLVQPGGEEHPDPERVAVSAGELARLQALLASMPPHMSRALVLFRIEGKSQTAIAEALGMSVSGVEKLLARAYRQLTDFRADSTTDRPTNGPDAGDRSKRNG